jgi:TPR repeat protein
LAAHLLLFSVIGEGWMKNRLTRLVPIAIFGGALLAAAQTAGIDAALLTKANAGDAASEVLVGENYAAGKDVSPDLKQAAAWYRKAAEQANLAGENHLAALCRDGGKGFPRDMVQATAWYRKAAEQGDTGAQGMLGVLYSYGQGVAQSYVEAYYWLDLAAHVKGPKQEQYAANRQMIGQKITVDELEAVEERVTQWLAAHPRTNASQ